VSQEIPGGRRPITGRDCLTAESTECVSGLWSVVRCVKGMEHGARSRWPKAQGARPKVEEINSSFLRYALGAMRYEVNRNKE
jgi:hypothetical protein